MLCAPGSVISAGPLRTTQAELSVRSNVHILVLDVKYRCVHYISEPSRFSIFELVSADFLIPKCSLTEHKCFADNYYIIIG